VFFRESLAVVSKFVHKYVKQHERSRLGVGEAAFNSFVAEIERETESFKDEAMLVEIRAAQAHPEVLAPCVKKNSTRAFPVIELRKSIQIVTTGRKDDPLEPLRQCRPFGNQVEERLNVSFSNYVSIASSGRLSINDVAQMCGRSMTVFTLHPSIFNFGRRAAIETRSDTHSSLLDDEVEDKNNGERAHRNDRFEHSPRFQGLRHGHVEILLHEPKTAIVQVREDE